MPIDPARIEQIKNQGGFDLEIARDIEESYGDLPEDQRQALIDQIRREIDAAIIEDLNDPGGE